MVSLESEGGLWVVLRDHDAKTLGRFAIDPSELRATVSGALSFNATNGSGSNVSIDGSKGALKVRLEGQGFSPKNCRIDAADVESAIKTLNLGV